ncbi:MAG TPA: hypothetical protein VGH15_00745 [Caulobacteraceae bacterium]
MRGYGALAAAAALSLTACEKQLEAPTDRGVCWHLVQPPHAALKFNVLKRGVPDLEHCAAELEKMRITFLSLGVPQGDLTAGAYQGQFLFLQREGAFTSSTLDGFRYPFMVRTGDQRLAIPGAMPPQPDQK